jgi:predicted AlkP superfamily phosphohydrolase/phosphomutase
VSDHGGRGFGGMFHINQWFRDRGWLVPKHQMRGQLRSRGFDRLYGLMPDWVKRAARPFTHQGVGHNLAHGVDEIFDMSRTRIYALTSGQIFINLKGRDPQGVVEPGAEYDELIEQVRDGLSQVRDPLTGRCLDITIWRREEIWSGPYLDRAPDLYVEMTDPYYSDAGNLNPRGALFSYYGEHYADFVGVHRRMGMLLAVGPDIQAGSRLEPVKITDVAPTALHLMGLPIPRDMDGGIPEGLFRPDSEAARRAPIFQDGTLVDQQAQDFGEEDAAVVAQRLRDLGYFE